MRICQENISNLYIHTHLSFLAYHVDCFYDEMILALGICIRAKLFLLSSPSSLSFFPHSQLICLFLLLFLRTLRLFVILVLLMTYRSVQSLQGDRKLAGQVKPLSLDSLLFFLVFDEFAIIFKLFFLLIIKSLESGKLLVMRLNLILIELFDSLTLVFTFFEPLLLFINLRIQISDKIQSFLKVVYLQLKLIFSLHFYPFFALQHFIPRFKASFFKLFDLIFQGNLNFRLRIFLFFGNIRLDWLNFL